MAQLLNIRLSRAGGEPWGLRLQGGTDFGTPLVVQKVSSNRTPKKKKKQWSKRENGKETKNNEKVDNKMSENITRHQNNN